MKGREILGETAALLLDDLEDNDNEEIIDALVVAVVHVDDGSEHGSTYLQTKCSRASWIFQLGLATALVEQEQNRRSIPRNNDDDDDEEQD